MGKMVCVIIVQKSIHGRIQGEFCGSLNLELCSENARNITKIPLRFYQIH